MFVYEYIDETPRDFPTLGIREVKKGDQITSETELNSPFLKDVTPKPKPTPNAASQKDGDN